MITTAPRRPDPLVRPPRPTSRRPRSPVSRQLRPAHVAPRRTASALPPKGPFPHARTAPTPVLRDRSSRLASRRRRSRTPTCPADVTASAATGRSALERRARLTAKLAKLAATGQLAPLARQIAGLGGCAHPIRLDGHRTETTSTPPPARSAARTTSTPASCPAGQLLVRCNNRRATRCPACAETYRRDTYHLIAAGLRGGKGIPDTVAAPPARLRHLHRPRLRPRPQPPRPPAAAAAARRHHRRRPALGTRSTPTRYDYEARCCGTPTPGAVAPLHHLPAPRDRQARRTHPTRPSATTPASPSPRSPSTRSAAPSTSTPSSASTAPTARQHPARLGHRRPARRRHPRRRRTHPRPPRRQTAEAAQPAGDIPVSPVTATSPVSTWTRTPRWSSPTGSTPELASYPNSNTSPTSWPQHGRHDPSSRPTPGARSTPVTAPVTRSVIH